MMAIFSVDAEQEGPVDAEDGHPLRNLVQLQAVLAPVLRCRRWVTRETVVVRATLLM